MIDPTTDPLPNPTPTDDDPIPGDDSTDDDGSTSDND